MILLPLPIEAVMLLKIKGLRRCLREFSCPIRFLITLNLKKLSDGWERGSQYAFRPYIQSLNVAENKGGEET